MSSHPTIVWFRRDLRLQDNPALNNAIREGAPIIPLYIHNLDEEGTWRRGSASQWWLHHALEDLQQQLKQQGLTLVIRNSTNSLHTLQNLIKETKATSIHWNRCYEPSFVKRDSQIKQALTNTAIRVQSHNGSLLLDPLEITNQSGNPFQVFTPFWKHCREQPIDLPQTESITASGLSPVSDTLQSLDLLPHIPWDQGMAEFWNPTREGGKQLLNLAAGKSQSYHTQRDIPTEDGTSRLSPYLHFGQISPRECFYSIRNNAKDKEKADTGILRQLYWREFSAHLLYHFPHSQDSALKSQYNAFPWEFNATYLSAWQRGQTGFPIVDAGMRQLWQTGWMHNRVRMIAGSLLVKHLLQPWQEGARWFWDVLVDADLPNNSMGWQWLAGSGADASPYFRVFNPIIQGKKFDPDGSYVKQWIPELCQLPTEFIHTPWEALPIDLASAGITLDKDYPSPIISHEKGRQNALDAYSAFKESIQ